MQPVVLQIIAAEVFEAGARAVFLQTEDIRLRHLPRKEGILRKILEVPPAQGSALDVDARREQDIYIPFEAVVRERGAHFPCPRSVPGVGKQLHGRIRGSGIGGLRAVCGALFHDAQPHGPVRYGEPRELSAEVLGVPEVFAADEPKLFLCGELFDVHSSSFLKNRA